MKLEVGRVLSSTWAMTKQRFWLLLGMWAVFFGIQMVYFTVMGAFVGGSMMALGSGFGSGSSDAMLGGLGAGAVILIILMYLGYFAITFASQAATALLGSPLENGNFGDALGTGFKSALTLFGVLILVIILYIVFALVYSVFAVALSFLGEAGGIVAALLFLPALIYLALRISVLVPVIAVERVFNPITAIKRTWDVTAGNVLGIFLVTLVALLIAAVFLGVPFLVMFGSIGALGLTSGDPSAAMGAAAISTMVIGFLLLIPLYIVFTIVSVVLNACLHAELADKDTESLEDTFA